MISFDKQWNPVFKVKEQMYFHKQSALIKETEAVKKDFSVFNSLPVEIKNNKDFVIELFNHYIYNPIALQTIFLNSTDNIKFDRDIVLDLIRKKVNNILSETPFITDEQCLLESLNFENMQNFYLGCLHSKEICKSEKLFLKAFASKGDIKKIMTVMDKELLHNREFIKECFKNIDDVDTFSFLKYLDEDTLSDKSFYLFVLDFIPVNPSYFRQLDNDVDIAEKYYERLLGQHIKIFGSKKSNFLNPLNPFPIDPFATDEIPFPTELFHQDIAKLYEEANGDFSVMKDIRLKETLEKVAYQEKISKHLQENKNISLYKRKIISS